MIDPRRLTEAGCRQGLEQVATMMRHLKQCEHQASIELDRATEAQNTARSMLAFAQLWRDQLRARLEELQDDQ
jgi:NADH:ubiquinone oxidoreductase subunit F (NADH-binding)